MSSWLRQATQLTQAGEDFVIVSVIAVTGSSPAEAGRRMLVCPQRFYGTIGGGKLEEHVLQVARSMLEDGQERKLEDFSLGAKLGQCCGGAVVLHYELMRTAVPQVVVFGAGHVARELAVLLARLPLQALFIDERADMLDKLPQAKNLEIRHEEFPADAVDDLPPQASCIIMTHSHALDLELAQRLLAKDSAVFLGVIGSKSKGEKFRARLNRKGLDGSKLACPIGQSIGKHPALTALAIAHEITSHMGFEQAETSSQRTDVRLLRKIARQA